MVFFNDLSEPLLSKCKSDQLHKKNENEIEADFHSQLTSTGEFMKHEIVPISIIKHQAL